MKLSKIMALLVVFVATGVAPSCAQVFWTNQSPAGVTDGIWCVTYGNGTFVATTDQGRVLTSTDGLTWTSQTVAQGTWLVSIAYGNGTWVAVGAGGTVLVSSDLQTWVNAKGVTTNRLNGVFYTGITQGTVSTAPNSPPIFIAVGESGTIITSPDAQTWTVQESGVTASLHGITIVNGENTTGENSQEILVSGQNGIILSGSGNGTGFSSIPSSAVPTSQYLEAILCQNPFNNYDYGAPPSPGIIEAVGDGGTIIYDVGLIGAHGDIGPPSWSSSPTVLPDVVFRGLTFGNGYLVAAGEQGTIVTSTDGINWTQRFSGDSPSTLSTSTLLSAAYSSTLQRFVVTGIGGTILVSNSTPTVFGNVSTRGYVSNSQTFIGGFVLEGTAPRTVLIRADGPVLSTFNVPNPLPDPVLTVYNSKGTVIATNTGWSTNTNPTTISTVALEVGAFALPNLSPDSALLLTLQPGAYTAQITSAKGNSGTALFEAYTD